MSSSLDLMEKSSMKISLRKSLKIKGTFFARNVSTFSYHFICPFEFARSLLISDYNIGNMKFLTYRTYTVHSRFHHNENRFVYQCPDCRQSFPRSFSVYRHLAQVHQKSPSQIHKIRKVVLQSRIQWKNLRTRKRYRKNTFDTVINTNEKAFLFDFEDCRDLNVCNICGNVTKT